MGRLEKALALPDAVGDGGQIGALCWRARDGELQVLMVTSRDTGRWVIPKGWPMPGKSPQKAAACEAWEEAGAEGTVSEGTLGDYGYLKALSDGSCINCRVAIFPLRVEAVKARYPERHERRRKWFDARKAARLVAEPELAALMIELAGDPSRLPGWGRLAKA